MELKYKIKLPPVRGQIVEDYLKTLQVDTFYSVYTLDDNLNLIECLGKIKNDGNWHYHHNYDNSENALYILLNDVCTIRWFSLNKEEVLKIQQENIESWKNILNKELSRLNDLQK